MKSSVFQLLLVGFAFAAVTAFGSGDTQAPPKLLSTLWGEDGELWEPEKGSTRMKMTGNAKDRWVGISSREENIAPPYSLRSSCPNPFS